MHLSFLNKTFFSFSKQNKQKQLPALFFLNKTFSTAYDPHTQNASYNQNNTAEDDYCQYSGSATETLQSRDLQKNVEQ